jgi:ribosomal protein L1
MARRPASVTQADVARAIRAAKAAGVDVRRIEIDLNGKIVIIVGNSEFDQREVNEWDRV